MGHSQPPSTHTVTVVLFPMDRRNTSIIKLKGEQIFETQLTGTSGQIRFDSNGFTAGFTLQACWNKI
jgi:hypothetical protein